MNPHDKVQHFVVTRLFVRAFEGQAPTEEWLSARWAMFEDFAAASIAQQSISAFTWLLLADPSLPRWASDRLEGLRSDVPQLQVVLVEKPFSPSTVPEALSARICPDASRVITSRFDSDDAIGPTFIEEVQRHASHGDPPFFINFPRGYEVTADGRLFTRVDPSNAFLSLVERPGAPVGVYVREHPDAKTFAPLLQRWLPPIWLQVVHGGNVGNVIRGARTSARGSWVTSLTELSDARYRTEYVTSRLRMARRLLNPPRARRAALRLLSRPRMGAHR